MSERARRIWFQRDTGRGKGPRLSKPTHDRRRVVKTSRRVEEASIRLQDLLRGSPAQCYEFGRNESAFGGVAGLEWFGHGAEVLAQASRLAGSQAKRFKRFRQIEFEQFSASRCRTERPTGARSMKAILIVAR